MHEIHIEKQIGDIDEEAWLLTKKFFHIHSFIEQKEHIHKVLHE